MPKLERACGDALSRRTHLIVLVVVAMSLSCARNDDATPKAPAPSAKTSKEKVPTNAADKWAEPRNAMVDEQISARSISDTRVLAAMRKVPRHEFVPVEVRGMAYHDRPLPIGLEQTISQPYIVAAMTELARIEPTSRVLEIGTGSGYQAAVLGEIAAEVYTIEIVEPLAKRSKALLERLGYANVHVRHGDGYKGWPTKAPFDAIIVTAAPPKIPEPLKAQLKEGGRLVIPVGNAHQKLMVVTRTKDGFDEQFALPVRFVPMTGEAQK